MPIIHKKGDLFTNLPVTEKVIIVHACNAQGVWGSGFAKQMKLEFPEAFQDYWLFCGQLGGNAVGSFQVSDTNSPTVKVGNLITSNNFGDKKDEVGTILANTVNCLTQLKGWMDANPGYTIVSPKINAGLFCVPWNNTENLLQAVVDKYGWTWLVYEL